jgi:hypothetical protein
LKGLLLSNMPSTLVTYERGVSAEQGADPVGPPPRRALLPLPADGPLRSRLHNQPDLLLLRRSLQEEVTERATLRGMTLMLTHSFLPRAPLADPRSRFPPEGALWPAIEPERPFITVPHYSGRCPFS